jgi:hypothetical protein
MKACVLVAVLALGAACGSPVAPDRSHPLRISASNGALQLTNVSDQRVFYFIYERQGAALINWAPCVDLARCSSVAAGALSAVPYSSIGGYAPGKTEAIVWWWYAVPGPADALVAGVPLATVVEL